MFQNCTILRWETSAIKTPTDAFISWQKTDFSLTDYLVYIWWPVSTSSQLIHFNLLPWEENLSTLEGQPWISCVKPSGTWALTIFITYISVKMHRPFNHIHFFSNLVVKNTLEHLNMHSIFFPKKFFFEKECIKFEGISIPVPFQTLILCQRATNTFSQIFLYLCISI